MKLEDIIAKAKAYHACDLADSIETWQDAADVLFSPQGQEFFENTGYPDNKAIKAIGKEVDGFYANKSIRLGNPPNLCIGGIGYHTLTYQGIHDDVPIILLNNANAVIKLLDYAVVKVVTFGDCDVQVEGDGTGIML